MRRRADFTTPFIVRLMVVAFLALAGQSTADPSGKVEPSAELELL